MAERLRPRAAPGFAPVWTLALAGAIALGACWPAPAPLAAQEPDSLRPGLERPVAAADTLRPPETRPDLEARLDPDSLMLRGGLSREARAALEGQLAAGPVIFEGDVDVPRDSAFTAPLLVVGGTLRFAGRSPGTVMVLGGDFFLRPGAEIAGDAVVIGGSFYGTGMARLAGERRVLGVERLVLLREPGAVTVSARPEPAPFPVRFQGVYGFLPEAYNRVDGLAVRWGLRYVPPAKRRGTPSLSAAALLRTSRDDVGWEAAAAQELVASRLRLRAAWYNLTDTNERWHRGDVETSLATLFLGEDNRFYFDRQGVELRAEQELRGPLSADLAVRNDTYRNVVTQDPFTVAEDDFLPNAPVAPGTMRSVLGGLTWAGRDLPEAPTRGWWARLEAEAAGGLLQGDHHFTTGRLDVRRTQPVGPHLLDARLFLAGRIGGTVPEQKRFHLGGAATLPGYEALAVRGDRTALLNLRYRIPVPALGRPRPFRGLFREGAWVMLLADGGDAWESRREDADWLGSVGAGIGGRGTLGDVGLFVVVPSEQVSADQSDVSVFLYFGRFF